MTASHPEQLGDLSQIGAAVRQCKEESPRLVQACQGVRIAAQNVLKQGRRQGHQRRLAGQQDLQQELII